MDKFRSKFRLVKSVESTIPDTENDQVEFIDGEEGDCSVFYTYVCPECCHTMKSHVFHMRPPVCSGCGSKTKHAGTERITLYMYESDEWFNTKLALESSYLYYNELSLRDKEWDFADIHHVRLLDVDGRRGARVFTYDAEDRPLSLICYYDNRAMFQEILNR